MFLEESCVFLNIVWQMRTNILICFRKKIFCQHSLKSLHFYYNMKQSNFFYLDNFQMCAYFFFHVELYHQITSTCSALKSGKEKGFTNVFPIYFFQ